MTVRFAYDIIVRKMSAEKLDTEKALAFLTLDEKIDMLSGDGMWHTYATGEFPRVRISDGPNGVRAVSGALSRAVPATCFPTASMLANSWDPALCYAVGASMGKEATALGVNLLLAPGINIKRDPLGGRNFEYFSEDPILAGEMGRAIIAGIQSTGVGACVKHFAANNREYMRMYSDSAVDLRALHEVYIRPFAIALDAQPAAVMCAYNKVRGVYCSESEFLLKRILRDELKFKGVVISDWGAVHDRAISLKAGVDLAMPGDPDFHENVKTAQDSGDVTETDIDESVRRLLTLIDDVYLEPTGDIDVEDGDRVAYNAAAASIVLLKNEDRFLPLTRNLKVAVCGCLAENAPVQGCGSSHVSPLKTVSPLDAFAMRGIEVTYCKAFSDDKKQNAALSRDAINAAQGCDAVVVFVGQDAPHEGIDRDTLSLPEAQNDFINAITATGKKVAVVLCSAGPVFMPWINRVYSVVYAGLNGQAGALAAVDVLYGRINPCGKLAETFPADDKDLFAEAETEPVYRESIFVGYKYYEAVGARTLFPFGHGLSFSQIRYDGMLVSGANDEKEVSVMLSNDSVRDAYEIVQVYVSDRTGRVLCAKKQLAGYAKVFVEGQTSVTAKIKLNKRAFEFFNVETNAFEVASGQYVISVAASAADEKLSQTVTVNGDFCEHIPYPDAYKLPKSGAISDEDYAKLPGAYLPVPREKQKRGTFTTRNCIADLKRTLIGKIASRVALHKSKSAGAPGSAERRAFFASATTTPLASAAVMSSGAMSPSTAKAIVAFANGKYLTGIKLFLKKH